MRWVSWMTARFGAVVLVLCIGSLGIVHAVAVDPVAAAIRMQVQQLERFGKPSPAIQRLAAFYAARHFAPAWTNPATLDQLMTALAGTADDGLDPNDYGLAHLQQQRAALANGTATPAQQAQLDLRATDGYLTALTQLYRGKVRASTLDARWDFDPRRPDPADSVPHALAAVDKGDIAAIFARVRPRSPMYDVMRAALARLYAVEKHGGWATLSDGSALIPGVRDARIPLLRQRLINGGYLRADTNSGDTYGPRLAAAVRRFQQAQALPVTGKVDAATRAALNVSVDQRIDQLRVNLERARWLLHNLHGDFVMVDIAGYQLTYYRDDKPIWSSPVQVGLPYRSTPEFKSIITAVTLNPVWTVPPTIFWKDMLPRIQKDPGYLAAHHLHALDLQGNPVDPQSVDWNDPRDIELRQDPGPGNALGRVLIVFPNDDAIYLHDTPHQAQFDDRQRAFSSGCIRVEHPRELAALLLDEPAKWSKSALVSAIATGHSHTLFVNRRVHVLLAYWTVQAYRDGVIGYRSDIYHRDAKLLAALDQPRVSPLDAPSRGATARAHIT